VRPYRVFNFLKIATLAVLVPAFARDASTVNSFRLLSSSRNVSKLQPCEQSSAPHRMVQVDAGLQQQLQDLRRQIEARADRLRMMEAENALMRKELEGQPAATTAAPMGTTQPLIFGSPIGPIPKFQEIPPLPAQNLLPTPPGMSCQCTGSAGEEFPATIAPPVFAWTGYLDHGHAVQLDRNGQKHNVADPELARALEQALQASASAQQVKRTMHADGFKEHLKAYRKVAQNSTERVRSQAAADLARAAMEKPHW